MHYYGTRLSENISRREPEGYLLCLNVPVARTGTQEYLPEELGLPAGSALVPVFRPEEEVFSPETMASFEGMPVTNDHPPEGVDVSNIRALQKGHAHNVRRGSGEESDLLLADLIITDPGLISLILNEGKREISCGYTYELREEDGRYIQRKIRGNHVAVVDAGRAGPRVCIKDEHPAAVSGGRRPVPDNQININFERSTVPMKKTLVKKLARMARDGDPEAIEAVAELLEEMAEGEVIEAEITPAEPEAAAEAVAEAVEEPAVVVETQEGNVVAIDEETASGILERLDQIIALLTPAAGDEDPAEDPVEEIVEAVGEAVEEAVEAAAPELEEALPGEGTTAEEVAEMVEEIVEPTLSAVLEPEDSPADEEGEVLSADALRAALNRMRPALSRMSRKQRRKVAGDIAAKLRKGAAYKDTDHRILASLADRSAKPRADGRDLGAKIMASRNPNYRK